MINPPHPALLQFRNQICPDVSLDSFDLTFKLLEEIEKLIKEKEEQSD